MEYAEYRLVYQSLKEHFGKGWLSVIEIAEYDGCDPRTAKKRYSIPKGAKGIDIAVLAKRKCALAHK